MGDRRDNALTVTEKEDRVAVGRGLGKGFLKRVSRDVREASRFHFDRAKGRRGKCREKGHEPLFRKRHQGE
jgi:hypothetical protein